MPARGTASNRGTASGRQAAVARGTASGRQSVDASAADDMTFLSETIVGAGGVASVTFSAISGAYRHLEIYYVARTSDAAAQVMSMRFNADTGANYDHEVTQAQDAGFNYIAGTAGATSIQIGRLNPSGAPADSMSTGEILLPYYSTTTQDKGAMGKIHSLDGVGTTIILLHSGGTWRTANAAITSIVLFPGAGNFVENSRFSLYGIT